MQYQLDNLDRHLDACSATVACRTWSWLAWSGCRRRPVCRVRLLEEGGYIDRYVALLNEAKVGRGFTVFVRVWLRGQDEDTTNHFINSIKSFPEVLECHLMAGDCDFLLRGGGGPMPTGSSRCST